MSLEDLRAQLIQDYRSSVGEDVQSESPLLEEEGPSALRQVKAGFSEGTGLVGNLLRAAEARAPEMAESIYGALPGFKEKEDLDAYYGEGFTSPYMSSSMRRQVIKEDRAERYAATYGDVEQSGFWYGLGDFGAMMADPTTLIPYVGIAKAGVIGTAAIYGGAYAGAESMARSAAEEGSINVVDAVLQASLGSTGSAALQKVISGPMQSFIASKLASGGRVSEKELIDWAKITTKGTEYEASLDSVNFSRMAEDLNTQFFNKSPEQAWATYNLELNTGNSFNPMDSAVIDYKYGKVDQFLKDGADAPKPPVSPFKTSLKEQMREFKALRNELRKAPTSSQRVSDVYTLKKYKEANPTPKNTAMADAFAKALGRPREDVLMDLAEKQSAEFDTYLDAIRDVPWDTVGSKIVQDASTLKSSSGNPKWDPSSADNDTLTRIIANKDVPYLSEAGDMLSGRIGKMVDPENLPAATEPAKKWLNAYMSGRYLVKPRKVFESYGPAGKMMSDSLTIAEANKLQKIAGVLVDTEKNFSKHGIKAGSPQSIMVTDLVRKAIDDADVPANVRAAASEIKMFYQRALRDQLDSGVINRETYDSLTKRAKQYGYANRVYDDEKLRTKKGREEWAEALSKVVFKNETDARIALESVLGERAKIVPQLLESIVKSDSSGRRQIPKDVWAKVAKMRGQTEPTRSKYIDNNRKIPEEFEKALSNFLVRDPQTILHNYAEDVYTRIEYAKVFGANDEMATALLNKIGKVASPDATKSLTQVYWDSVRDPRSDNIMSFVDKSDIIKGIHGGLRAFEVLRLGLASILTLAQPFVTGSLKLTNAKGMGSMEGLATMLKGNLNGYRATFGNAAMKEEAMRSGAANQIMVMNHMGQINEAYNRIFPGKMGGGTWNPINILNNPQEFLRVSGFFKAEGIARTQGYFQGKAYIESLLDKQMKLLAKGNKANPKKLAEIEEGLFELGIPKGLAPDQVTADMVERGGQMFSNQINFLNTPNEIPLAWNSFYGKITRQFQSFAFHHGSFVLDNVIKPLRGGNAVPAFLLFGALPYSVGMPTDNLRRLIMQDDSEYSATEEYFRGLAIIGGLGIVQDSLDRAAWRPEGFLGVLAGPAAQDVSSVVYGATATVKKSMQKGELDLSPARQTAKDVIPYARAFMKDVKAQKTEMDKHYGNLFNDF